MAKRFTDSDKFKDIWYRKLTPKLKCLWEFLIAECNHAGIIELDLEFASFVIGETISQDDLISFENKIQHIEKDLYFIPNFITFQYGELNPQSKVHASVLKELEKYNIDRVSIGLHNPKLTTKDKYKDKDKDKYNNIPAKNEILDYCNQLGKKIDIDSFIEYYNASNWLDDAGLPINWKRKVITWANNYKPDNDGVIDTSHIFRKLEAEARKAGKI